MKNLKKRIVSLLLMLALLIPSMAMATEELGEIPATDDLVVLGANLSDSQKEKVLDLMGIDSLDGMTVVTVSIEEEKALLGSLVSADKIGSRSISSARITLGGAGSGISVTTHNIDYITPTMYSSALTTAGIEDAAVVIAAPTEVSGTAALAGIFKAYELAKADPLDAAAKLVASEELLLSGELAEFIGSEEAVKLIAELKQMVLDNGWDNEETIRPAVLEVAKELGFSLTDEQVDQVVALLLKFCSLDMDPEAISKQLQSIVVSFQNAAKAAEGVTSFFAKIGDFFSSVGGWFKGLFGKN